jgi:endonuclease G
MNRERRLAFVAAVNFDANARFEHERQGKDKWFLDPRIPKEFQTNEALYADNPFDRGHLVRRADAAWGETEAEAKLANDDTFHFTNCSPQHAIFNQSSAATKRNLRLWGNLENHITDEARADNKKLCIFNGPVFHSDDKSYRGILIPREFWKVVVFEKENGEPGALAFLLSQAELIEDLPEEDFEAGEFHTFQLKISELEKMTQLNFGVLKSYDPLEDETNESALEAGTKAVPLARLKDVVL